MALAAVMTLSMSGFALEEVFADTPEECQELALEAEREAAGAEAGKSAEEETVTVTEETGETDSETAQEKPDSQEAAAAEETEESSAADSESQENVTEEAVQKALAAAVEEQTGAHISITVEENKDDSIRLTWEIVSDDQNAGDAAPQSGLKYTVLKEARSSIDETMTFEEEENEVTTEENEYTFTNLFPGRIYKFTVTAVDENGDIAAMTTEPAEAQPVLSAHETKTRTSGTVSYPAMQSFNGTNDLRKQMPESYNGYAVMQGGCTDGEYVYYLMVSSYNQHGRIVKVDMSNNDIVKVSDVVDIWHGNGMTYDSRRNELVVNGRNEGSVRRKQELTCIDADTLKIVEGRQRDVKYTSYANDNTYFTPTSRDNGIGAIAYNEKYDVYVALQREYHNYVIYDPDTFEAMGLIMTRINKKYPGTYQAMDCDDQYIYQLLSKDTESNKQPDNLILAMDWGAERLIDSEGHRIKADIVTDLTNGIWKCQNPDPEHDREPVAVYTINTPYEAENIYHTTDKDGRTHFYLSEYNANQQYVTKSYKEAYKAKWKKVKKKVKVKVKWKKVKKKVKWKKVNGKWKYKTKKVWKYKYKWKKKKVWKYKTKYRTKYYQEKSYKDRLAHVYDLGVI